MKKLPRKATIRGYQEALGAFDLPDKAKVLLSALFNTLNAELTESDALKAELDALKERSKSWLFEATSVKDALDRAQKDVARLERALEQREEEHTRTLDKLRDARKQLGKRSLDKERADAAEARLAAVRAALEVGDDR